jgi:membrane dipeptidase
MSPIPVFDGHNDVLLRLWSKVGSDGVADFLTGDGLGHIDLPRMNAGGFAGGMFAIFAPSDGPELPADDENDLNPPPAGQISQPQALRKTVEMTALLLRIEAASKGQFKICRSAGEIRACLAAGTIAAVLHIEGAEAIDENFAALDVLHAAGLRSIGPVWSRSNVFGQGVPFRFPATGDIGDGLTALGKDLIRQCNAKRILVDLSHLNEKGFWDVAKISDAPLVATHSNALALCSSSRNLSDDQIRAIGASGGMIGLNFATGFLRSDGHWRSDTPVEVMLGHIEHIMALAGEDSIALGSDFDGARIPSAIGDASGLPVLLTAMREKQYGEALIAKIAHGNWLRVLEKTWG